MQIVKNAVVCSLIIAGALLFLCHCANAEQLSITIRAVDGAALVTGEEVTIRTIQKQLYEQPKKKWTVQEIDEFIKKGYGEQVTVQQFARMKLGESGSFELLRMTLRRAVLRGEVPPMEFLEEKDAGKVLEVFGFRVMKKEDFDSLSEEEKIREAFMREGTLVVISGTEPGSVVEIIQVRKKVGSR